MKTSKGSIPGSSRVKPVKGASRRNNGICPRDRKRTAGLVALALMMAGAAEAASNIPPGLTGLWRFQESANKLVATVGQDLKTSNTNNSAFFLGPWTEIGIDSWLSKFSDGGVVQERSYDYLTVNPGFAPNGGGNNVNEYTVAIDYVQTSGNTTWNSLFQTASDGNTSDGDLWITGADTAARTIYTTELGSSTLTFDSSKWHRIVWSVDNGNFFRVYVDGTLFLDGAGQPIDGRYSLIPDKFHLFADNDWEDQWGLVSTVATWNRALTSAEVADLGGWIGTNTFPTHLILSEVPEITSITPTPGQTNVAPHFAYRATMLDPIGLVNPDSLQLLLDGAAMPATFTNNGAALSVTFSSGGLIRSGSTHTYSLTDGSTYTNSTTFTVQNYTSYEWGFTNANLGVSLGNGVMTYAGDSSSTTFGTTDGSTVPHINGDPAQYMYVPAFIFDTDGYWVSLDESAPNVSSEYINRYAMVMDVMVPSPWLQTWLVPFFNTDPYNLNDADFYLAGDGRIGIGSGGYAVTNTIGPDTWYRIAFVADLAANTLTYYVNGTNVWSRNADGLGGRWALYSNQDPGPDLLLFNEPTGTSTHELYLSSWAFTDRVIDATEAAALGGPDAAGIFIHNFATPPNLTIQAAGGGATISWPADYVGFSLEQSDSITAPTWKPVPGVTNNAVTLNPTGAVTFFRLVQ